LLSDTGLVPVCCGVEEGIGEASLAFVARKEPSAIDLPGELGEGLLAGMLTGLEIGLGMVVVVAEFMLDLWEAGVTRKAWTSHGCFVVFLLEIAELTELQMCRRRLINNIQI
jgi:hypothetical protein